MPLQGSTLSEGATTSSTGGTSKTYSVNGNKVTNGIYLIDASVTDFRVRPYIIAKSVAPKLVNGKWKKGSITLQIGRPKILADGTQEFPNIEITLEWHPENTQAEVDMLVNLAAQSCCDADFTTFWRTGALA